MQSDKTCSVVEQYLAYLVTINIENSSIAQSISLSR